jgi:thymidylate synthase
VELTLHTVDEAFLATVPAILDHGRQAEPRGLATIELPDPVHLRIVKPWVFPLGGMSGVIGGRALRHAITAVEACSLIGQTSIPEAILDRVKAFRPFLNGSIFWGAYGPRAAGDLGLIVELLSRDPDSRQAVVSLYDSDRDLGRPSVVDVPCTVAIQFRLRDGRLAMWVQMRSNDAWLGLPYDLGQFALLQSAVAWALGVPMGTYTHSAGSMHLYARDLHKALALDSSSGRRETGGLDLGHMAWGAGFRGGEAAMAAISSRCRRLLLGHPIPDPTALEALLASWLASPSTSPATA